MIYALLASFLWGVSYYSYSSLTRSGAQYWVLSLLLLPLSIFTIGMTHLTSDDRVFRLPENLWLVGAYVGATLLANICVYLSFKGQDDVFLMTTIEMTYPVFMLVFLILFQDRSFQWKDFCGLFLVLCGLFLVK